MLSLRHITKIYDKNNKNSIKALDNINIDFPETGLVFITGESGCGKSTLLNIIGGLDSQTAGDIYFDQQHIYNNALITYRKQEISFIFQKFNLIDTLTVEENLRIVFELDNQPYDLDVINSKLSSVGLSNYNNRLIKELSGGEQQRVAIARAMLRKSKILLADEPTGNLDELNSETIFNMLKTLSKDKLVIVVSHESEYVDKYADRIIIIKDGHIVNDLLRNVGVEEFIEQEGIGYICKKISRKTVERINTSNCSTFFLVNKEKFSYNQANLEPVTGKKYVNNNNSQLSLKTSLHLAFSKITNHKIRLSTMLIVVMLAFSLFAVSLILSNFDIGKISAEMFSANNESAIMFRSGTEIQPFGQIKRNKAYISNEKKSIIEQFANIQLDPYYANLNSLFLKDSEADNPFIKYYFSGHIETSAERLNLYGFKILYGSFPTLQNEIMQVALTDYTAYIIEHYGAIFNDNDFIIGIQASDLVGKTINLGSQSFLISGIIDTDYENFLHLLNKDVDQEDNSRFQSRLDLYYNVLYFPYKSTAKIYKNFKRFNNAAIMSNSAIIRAINGQTINNIPSNLNSPKITWSDRISAIDDDSLIMTSNMFKEYFGETFSTNKNYTYDFIINSNDQIIFRKSFAVIGVITNVNLDYLPHTDVIVFSDDNFSTIANKYVILTGLFGELPESKSDKIKLINMLVDNTLYHESADSKSIYDIYDTMRIFKSIFLYVSIILLIIASILIFEFFKANINNKKKDIGILMALGLNRRGISKIFLIQIIIMTTAMSILTVIGIFLFSIIMSVVIKSMLTASLASSIVHTIPIITYSLLPFLTAILALIICVIVSTSIPIIKINLSSPIKNIKS